MVLILLWFTAFIGLAGIVLGVSRWLAAVVVRYPQARLEFERRQDQDSWWARAVDLAVEVASREWTGQALDRFHRRVALDLQRLGPSSVRETHRFVARSLLEGIALAGSMAGFLLLSFGRPMLLLSSSLAALYAFALRPYLLHIRAQGRIERISRRLPYAVDLAALTMGAGGTPREALEMMAGEASGPLAEELSRALMQMNSGAPQNKALLRMAQRLDLEDLTALVLAINRGESTGAPMAKALETQAEVFRFRRLQRAERLAVEAPVKMMFPNMLIMIAVLLLVLGPVLVKLAQDGWM